MMRCVVLHYNQTISAADHVHSSFLPRHLAPRCSPSPQTLELLLPLLILLTVLLFLLLVFLVFLLLLRRSRRGAIQLGEAGGPTNLEQEDELEGEGGLQGIEQRWLEQAEEATRAGYLRGKGALAPIK